MNIEKMLAALNPEIVERLKTAVEIGKWPNGIALTKEQRSGYIDRGSKKDGEECDDDHHKNEPEFKPIRFV